MILVWVWDELEERKLQIALPDDFKSMDAAELPGFR